MTKEELLQEENNLTETIRELKELIASPVWKKYSDLIESQVEGRINTFILSPLATLDGALEQEYAKGEIAGMRLSLGIIPSLIDNMAVDLDRVNTALGAEDE